ncbi:MAG: Imm32 family immunity protein [Actinobacteria bacterium]|nr:Imm32 family immunity protein [Actinomycetota bacterium]
MNYILSFELSKKDNALEIHFDTDGLEHFISLLNKLRKDKGHLHLMTSEWGGNDLSSKKLGEDNYLLNHVKIFLWEE